MRVIPLLKAQGSKILPSFFVFILILGMIPYGSQ